MSIATERNWTAHLVISCEHAGLKPYFKGLEYAMYHALARIDDPIRVREYIAALVWASETWCTAHAPQSTKK